MTQLVSPNPTLPSPAALGWSRLPAAYAIPSSAPTLEEARAYCANLAQSHYENFSVATWFLPKGLRQQFYNVYSYCRISDDLGDEVGDTAASLELLDQWQRELDACYEGAPRHPVFVALAETVRQFEIPKHEFSDLLIAFRQDQTVTRFETFNDVLGYCRYSANPVGHLVLYLCGYKDAERQRLSDFTCTALQLANFWQDLGRDAQHGRLYVPEADCLRHGVDPAAVLAGQDGESVHALVLELSAWARELMCFGAPLVHAVPGRAGWELRLVVQGGLRVLERIEGLRGATLKERPKLGWADAPAIAWRALRMRAAASSHAERIA
jgi:squalene synthase HpnC